MAFEAAHQLRRQGGEVEAVLMIDTRAKYPTLYEAAWQILRMRAQGKAVPLSRLFKRAGQAINLWMLGQRKKVLSWPLAKLRNIGMPNTRANCQRSLTRRVCLCSGH